MRYPLFVIDTEKCKSLRDVGMLLDALACAIARPDGLIGPRGPISMMATACGTCCSTAVSAAPCCPQSARTRQRRLRRQMTSNLLLHRRQPSELTPSQVGGLWLRTAEA